MVNRALLCLAALVLAACGAVYISPDVKTGDAAGLDVAVTPITAASVARANAVPYTPRSLPAAFYRVAGTSGGMRGAGALPPPSAERQDRPASLATRLPPAADPGPYRLGVGDVLRLAVRDVGSSAAELSGLLAVQSGRQDYTVQDDGAIAIPGVGRVRVAGLTLDEAEAAVFDRLVDAQIDPAFSLEVIRFNSSRVAVGGAVAEPRILKLELTPLYLEEALAAAGGVEGADTDYAVVRLYRDGTLYQVPVSALANGQAARTVVLQDGDSVFVDTAYDLDEARAYFAEQIRLVEVRQSARVQALRELEAEVALRRGALAEARSNFEDRLALGAEGRDYVYLTGEVRSQARVPLPFGRRASLADALFGEGGFATETGNPSQIYVLRAAGDGPGDAITAWHLDASNAANMVLATRFELRPNDVVFVAEQPITRWNRVVRQIVPSLFQAAATASN